MGNFDFPEEAYTEIVNLIDKHGLNIVLWTLSCHLDAQDELIKDTDRYCARGLLWSLRTLLGESQGYERV